METARKLQWDPDFIHVSGWMCALVPLYMRRINNDSPAFRKARVVYTIFPGKGPENFSPEIFNKLKADGLKPVDFKKLKDLEPDALLAHKIAILYSDVVVFHGVEPDPALREFAESHGVEVVALDGGSDHADDYDTLYNTLQK